MPKGCDLRQYCIYVFVFSPFSFQLKKIYPDLHIKLPGKRLLGNNFDPGK